jgi:hypothetical protein
VFGVSPYLKPIFSFLLSCLFILHVYWFFLCCRILLSFFYTGQAEDLANKTKGTEKEIKSPSIDSAKSITEN